MRADIPLTALSFLVFVTRFFGAAPTESRALIDRLIERRVYKVIGLRKAGIVIVDRETLSPNLNLNSWASFSSATHASLMIGSTVDLAYVLDVQNGAGSEPEFEKPKYNAPKATYW